MSQQNSDYAIVKTVSSSYSETIEAITKTLVEQGFGILTNIDISATLKNKINVDYPRTIILGACNPPFAHRALSAVADVAVLLPCNVVVRENDQGQVEIAALNPRVIEQHVDNPEVRSVAKEIEQRIRTAMDGVN
jgi:uncharacterized protein (DUF302 family)